MRFVFAPPAEATTGLLTLPWREPIEEWEDERLVERELAAVDRAYRRRGGRSWQSEPLFKQILRQQRRGAGAATPHRNS